LLPPECTLPPLPNERWGPSLDLHDDRPVLCGLSTCWQLALAAGGWVDLAHTLHSRWYHSTAKTSSGLLLVGGSDSSNTTEILPVSGGPNTRGMALDPGRKLHCSIQISASSMVLTGGRVVNSATNIVTSHDLETGNSTDLPSMMSNRYHHACGSYNLPEFKMILVAGGWNGYGPINSTEVLEMDNYGSKWREVGMLPSPRYGLRGATLDKVLYVTGGDGGSAKDTDEVLAWDTVAEAWAVAGHLAAPRRLHAVTPVFQEYLQSFCL